MKNETQTERHTMVLLDFFIYMPPFEESNLTLYTSVLQQSSLEIPSETCPELCLLGDSYSIHDENKTNIRSV